MFRGPFKIEISTKAERIDVDALPGVERTMLTHGIRFSQTTHVAYRFFVSPSVKMFDDTPPRREKRVSFHKVNRVIVRIEADPHAIELLGMYPTTLKADGCWELDLNGSANLDLIAAGVGSLKLSAEGKRIVRLKNKPLIQAHRTNSTAQWIFFREWLESAAEFRFMVLCRRALDEDQRHLVCDAAFQDRGRTIEFISHHRIHLPALPSLTK